ncbi:AAA family ATPase [Undibacterium sp. Ji42W]|uniref:AAA family ATPase n=1 Tax=Undibacterium sp. Ji42W TaxID=3413039 RepID=UPI003BF18205
MITAIAKSKKELGLGDNKEIRIQSIKAIEIEKFRTFQSRTVELGSHVTLLIGRNGTMKTSLMGLIAHPFSSLSKDAFGRELKTVLKDVFRLSEIYDKEQYTYSLLIEILDSEPLLKEEVKIYYTAVSTNRHRVVVSGAEKGDGNFTYNTSFLNLKRLLPLVDTKARPDSDKTFELSSTEKLQQKDFYESVLPSTEYGIFAPIHQKGLKTTFAPTGKTATYDYESISSGEDNLGAIFNRLVGFQRAFKKGQPHGNGIFCIDEFESSLHPIAQVSLFNYLYKWAMDYKVQIVITTHSLHLIQNIYLKHNSNLDTKRIVFNFVSCATANEDKNYPILINPEYQLAYKELTLEKPQDVIKSQKIDIFCEDEMAIHYIKKLIKKRNILELVNFHSNLKQDAVNQGTPYTALVNLCKNFPLLLQTSLVVFDADVKDSDIAQIKNTAIFLVLPDANNLAIERRIIHFIISLKNDDPFFRKFGNEKTWFLHEFKQHGIKSLTATDIENESIINISHCKKWANSNIAEFKKYVTYYCNHSEFDNNFTATFLDRLNKINSKKGLPVLNNVTSDSNT